MMHKCINLMRVAESIEDYLKRTTHQSVRAIAKKIGMTDTTLQRQLNRGDVEVGVVVEICRAYKLDMLSAFIAADFVTPDEAGQMQTGASLRNATDRQLVEEMLRRIIEAEGEHPDLENPVTEALIDAAEQLVDEDRQDGDVSGDTDAHDLPNTIDDLPYIGRVTPPAKKAAKRGKNEADIPHAE